MKQQARGMREIWADFTSDSIVCYQAYGDQIADTAIAAQRFVAPFSFSRMTWIKPSFLWLMHRSHWATRSGQTRVLAVRMDRSSFERALSLAVPTAPEPSRYPDPREWEHAFASAQVHVQWDTERSLRGGALLCESLQLGISRHLIEEFATRWIVEIKDLTNTVRSIRKHLLEGHEERAKRLLPVERPFPLSASVAQTLCATR